MTHLCAEEFVHPEEPQMLEKLTANDKRVWDFSKIELVFKGNLHALFVVRMSLCNTDIKNQAKSLLNATT